MAVTYDLYDHSINSDTKETPLTTRTENLKTTWDLVPADTVTVKKIQDSSLKAAVEKSIKINQINVRGSGDGAYVNFLGDADAAKAAYDDVTYARLLKLKNEYDPTNVFRLNQNIDPGAAA